MRFSFGLVVLKRFINCKRRLENLEIVMYFHPSLGFFNALHDFVLQFACKAAGRYEVSA